MPDEDEELPLASARRIHGDPELLAAYESARAELRRIPAQPSWFDDSREAREAWSARHEPSLSAAKADVEAAWQAVTTDFKSRLRRGELVATGKEAPITKNSERTVIPAHLWDELVPNFHRSSAAGEGLKFVSVRVRRADVAQGAVSEDSPPEPSIDEPPAQQQEPRAGRPSVMPLLTEEMQRRAQRGELCDRITSECRALRAWAEQNLQGRDIPKVDSIRKR